MVDFTRLVEVVDKMGTIALAIFFGLAFMKGWIVPRWTYDKLARDCDRMTELALRGTHLAERGVSAAEKKVQQ